MNAFIVCLLLLFAQVCADRWALVVTIAGTRKLSDYFEWGCRTIENSKDIADMLVFHEGNERLKHVTCASNVKFISLGENGFAKHIISEFMGISNLTSQENREHLTTMLSDIIVHMPKYLLEIKPAIGMLFRDYLIPYSHWSSTDPDIIWGNLTNWIDIADTQTFDIVSVSKVLDAGRLFLRSQVRIVFLNCSVLAMLILFNLLLLVYTIYIPLISCQSHSIYVPCYLLCSSLYIKIHQK